MNDNNFYFKNQTIAGISLSARLGMYQQLIKLMQPGSKDLILDVGVSTFTDSAEANVLERNYPFPEQITMLGIEEGGQLEQIYPGAVYRKYTPGQALPFADKSFEICYCHAVLEHVGSRDRQERFISELLRVGKSIFLTTPNRFYPLELHTMMPFLHWLPMHWYRAILRLFGKEFYGKEENLNLLSRHSLDRLMRKFNTSYRIVPFRFLGLISNLILVVK
jgi:SAM-dependent methyltransferase